MREIKIRMWHNKQQKMTYFDSPWICHEYNSLCFGEIDDSCRWGNDDEIKNYVLMQFTGLKDIKGVEIWEDDYIKDRHGNINRVKWQNGTFRCATGLTKMGSIKAVLYGQRIFQEEMIVIGNIHENPEILRTKK